MIFNLIINFVLLLIGLVFSILPTVTLLPPILGVDIDTELVNGIGMMNSFFEAFWVLGYLVAGGLAIASYHISKRLLTFIFGSRTPH